MSTGFREGSGKTWEGSWLGKGLEPLVEKVELLDSMLEGWTGPRERRDAAKSGSDASRNIAVARIRTSHVFKGY